MTRNAKLAKTDLRHANLAGDHLTEADLTETNLAHATLTGANLERANLAQADLSAADIRRANLTGADLTGATLRGARLDRVDLTEADLTGADLTDTDLGTALSLTGATLDRVRGLAGAPPDADGSTPQDVVLDGSGPEPAPPTLTEQHTFADLPFATDSATNAHPSNPHP